MSRTWEYYQQHANLGPATLWWICGAASAFDTVQYPLVNNAICAVPFDIEAAIRVT